jgi:hypothetical protein
LIASANSFIGQLLNMDTVQISKIEKGLRQLKPEQKPIIVKRFKTSSDELITLLLAVKINEVVKNWRRQTKVTRRRKN